MRRVKHLEIIPFNFRKKKCFEQKLRSLENDEKLREKEKEEDWKQHGRNLECEKFISGILEKNTESLI